MPNYEYSCVNCDKDEERNVKIDERESQFCRECGYRLKRVWAFNGAVWAPTSGGHR